MPILYASVVNTRRQLVFEGLDKKFKSNYNELVLEQFVNFQLFAKKTIQLDEQHSLHYSHEGSWVIVCISRKPDVTLYEAFNFLEKLKQGMSENQVLSDITMIQSPDAYQKFKKHGKEVTKFITNWNSDPNNRDKTYLQRKAFY